MPVNENNIMAQHRILQGLHRILCESPANDLDLSMQVLEHFNVTTLSRQFMADIVNKIALSDANRAIELSSKYRLYKSLIKLVYRSGRNLYSFLYKHLNDGRIPLEFAF